MAEKSPIERMCESCGAPYLAPVAELEFRRASNMPEPTLCPECRLRGRNRRNVELMAHQSSGGPGTFGIGAAPETRSDRAGRQPGRRGASGRSQLYNAVCSQCGAETQVPFVPRGDRPVYCRDCYNARRGR